MRPDNALSVLVGDPGLAPQARTPFDAAACDFLAALAAALRTDDRARQFPDLQTFAFWCRPSAIGRLKARYAGDATRLGRGLVLHIAPANVPVNAAYTFAFGLLAGNANLVRLPSRPSRQMEIFCDVLNRLLVYPEHAAVKAGTAFVRYPHDAGLTERFSARCQGRVIWGGDATVRTIRAMPLPERAVELTFADRYSLCLMNADAVAGASELDLARLGEAFYNDTYLMDQNACSSPHLVLWHGAGGEAARERFWQQVSNRVAAHYDMPAVHAVDKYAQLLDVAIGGAPTYCRRYENRVYIIGMDDLAGASERLRGRFGLFYEKEIARLDEVVRDATPRYQTLTYFGFDREMLGDLVLRHRPMGIDRIVPVGKALDIDVIWDGHDIIGSLSRIVDIR